MAIVINGDGSISGISAGGLPTGSVTADTLATNSVDSAELIDGAVDNSHLATGIDAIKLADGTVTNSELQYINTLSSNAQTQISAAGLVAQIVTEVHTAYATGSTDIPADDTIPQNDEGTEIITKAITPTSATNRLLFIFEGNLQNSSTQNIAFTMFQDSGTAAIAQAWCLCHYANHQDHLGFTYDMVSGTTSSTTFKIRMGGETGTYRTNGHTSARRYGGNSANRLTIIEYTP